MALSNGTFYGHAVEFVTEQPEVPVIGQMYVDKVDYRTKIFNGRFWECFNSVSTSALVFNGSARNEAAYEEELCEKHPGLKELKEQLKEAQEKFAAYKALVQE